MAKILDNGQKDLQEERRGLTTATRNVLGDEWDGQDMQPTHSHSKHTQIHIQHIYIYVPASPRAAIAPCVSPPTCLC